MNEIDGQILQVVISHAMLLYIKREKRERKKKVEIEGKCFHWVIILSWEKGNEMGVYVAA